MNCIVFFKDEVSSAGEVIVRDKRATYIKEWHKPVVGLTMTSGIWEGKLGIATVLRIDENEIYFTFTANKEPPSKRHIAIVAVPRPQSIKKVLHNGVALGLREIHFISTSGVVPGYLNSKMLRESEMKNELLKALEQSCDTIPPIIEVHRNWNYFIKEKLPLIIDNYIPLCADTYSKDPLDPNLKDEACVAIGPESGWSSEEREVFYQLKFKFISLGSRMLRVDQAMMRIIPSFLVV